MSYPEDPVRPEGGAGAPDSAGARPGADGPLASVVRGFQRHVRTWPRRYVEMRIEARTGEKPEL